MSERRYALINKPSGGDEVNDLTSVVTWANIPDANVPASAVTQHEAALDHDALLNFAADEHATPKNSIEIDTAQLQLVNDAASPGNSKQYATSGAGVKGWYTIPTGGAEVNDLTADVTWANIPIANVPTGTTGTTVSLGDHLHAGVYEPVDATILREADVKNSIEIDVGELQLVNDSAAPGNSFLYGTSGSGVKGWFAISGGIAWQDAGAGTIHTDNYIENVPTALSAGTVNSTTYGITSDGGADDIILPEATTVVAGLLGAGKWDEIVANTLKTSNVTTNITTNHATSTVEVESSDGNNGTINQASSSFAGVLSTVKFDEIVANTLKTSNETHTGQVTGSGALVLDVTAVTAQPASGALVGADTFITNDGGVLSESTMTQLATFIGVGSITNISISHGTGEVIVESSDGTDGTINSATASFGGILSATKYSEIVANTAKAANATHTGDVTGSVALTIAAQAVDIAMLADGTDGELITWSTSGVATTVPVGTVDYVLTSNGAGLTPTFKVVPSGATNISISHGTGEIIVESSTGNDGTINEATASFGGILSATKFSEIVANTAKDTNATHTDHVTGSGALTVVVAAITGQTDIGADLVATDEILVSDGGAIRRADISRLNTYLNGALSFATVTDVNVGMGMDFVSFTTSGTVTLGTPSSLTGATTNAITSVSHTHAIDTTGTGDIVAAVSPTFTGTPIFGAIQINNDIDLNGDINGDGASIITGIETINIDSTGDITKASHGNYLYHKSSTYNGDQAGEITFSTSDPSAGVDGDIWYKY